MSEHLGEKPEDFPDLDYDTVREIGCGGSCTVFSVAGKDSMTYAVSLYRRGSRSSEKANIRLSSYRAIEEYWRRYFNTPAHQVVPPSWWRIDQGQNGRYYITQIQPFIMGCDIFASQAVLQRALSSLPPPKQEEALGHIRHFLTKLKSMPLHPHVAGKWAELPEITGPRNVLLDRGGNVSIVDMNNALIATPKPLRHIRNRILGLIFSLTGPLTIRSAYTRLLSTYVHLKASSADRPR